MREENYFEKKLETARDTLRYTISELEHVDIQIQNLTATYENDLEFLNERVIQLQESQKALEKRIPELEKKFNEGYTCIDARGKAHKSFAERHKANLKELIEEAEKRYIKRMGEIDTMKKKGEIKNVAEAPAGETIESQTDRELRLLKERYEELQAQKKELEARQKEAKKEPEPLIIESNDNEIAKAKAVKAQINQVSKELGEKINREEAEKIWVENSAQGQALSKLYKETEGGNAVWNGVVTKGFRTFCEENNYRIGE